MEALVVQLVVSETQELELGHMRAEGQRLHRSRSELVVVQV